MRFLHYLIILPLLAVVVWVVCCATSSEAGIGLPLWPDYYINPRLALACFALLGYIMGRIGAWFGYSPVRRDLRQQRRANRELNKEQAKLNETVTGLKQNIVGLQEKAKIEQKKADEAAPKSWWQRFKKAEKKGD